MEVKMKKILILMLLLLVVATMFADRKYNNGQFIMETNGDVDMTGNYLLDSQSITNLASKGASYWFDGVDDYISIGDGINLAANDFSVLVKCVINTIPTGDDGEIFSIGKINYVCLDFCFCRNEYFFKLFSTVLF